MEKAGDHQSRAADLLGISERMLRYKLRKYRLKAS
jgi:DNA-binding protein Fis